MNYFIEGLQGSGKSTLLKRVKELKPGYNAFLEGDYSPVELAWCSYVDRAEYTAILDRYGEIRDEIEQKTFREGDNYIICYTRILTDIPGFHKDLEQYDIYNGRRRMDEFRDIVLNRYRKWNTDNNIFECSLFQNAVEDMILYREMEDDEIMEYYRQVRAALEGREYRILYLKADDIAANISLIRKERSDDKGNELWYPLMMQYFNTAPWSVSRGKKGFDDLIEHFAHRQELELRICQELFAEKTCILTSKNYTDETLNGILSLTPSPQVKKNNSDFFNFVPNISFFQRTI